MSQRTEICKVRKSAGLSCNGCRYEDDCEEKNAKQTEGVPADIKPGTKQAKIYRLLKEGKTAKEIIATKEFASESVYIVARKYFPDAIDKTKSGARKKEAEKATMEFIENYFEKNEEKKPKEATTESIGQLFNNNKIDKIDERIMRLERLVAGADKAEDWMISAKALLEQGYIIDCYKAICNAIKELGGEI